MYGAHECGVALEPVLFNTVFSLEKSCTACFFCPAIHVLHASTCSFYLLTAICYTRCSMWHAWHVIYYIYSCQRTHNAQLIAADPSPATCCPLPLALCFSRRPSSQLAISVLAAPPRPGKTQKIRWVRLPPCGPFRLQKRPKTGGNSACPPPPAVASAYG